MNKKEGLTIIELLVTISIIASTIVVVLVLGDKTVSQSNLFALNTQATFLAKEGVEILSDSTIREEIKSGLIVEEIPTYWRVNYNGEFEEDDEDDCNVLMKIEDGEFYGYGGSEQSPFSRCITIWRPTETELRIKARTEFEYKGEEYNVELYRIFYD
jgi:hypothetical protein